MDYVIIGAGPAGVIAAEALRSADPQGTVVLLCGEDEPPYSRMAIPYLLTGGIGEDGTYLRHGEGHFQSLGIDVRMARAASVDPDKGTITLEDGNSLHFDRLLIATGSHPSRPPVPGMDLPGVESCWTMDDARRIAESAKTGSRVVLMGAGFIGCIVLEALAARGVDLSVVETEDRMLPRMMDDAGAAMIKRWCESKGVRVLTATAVEAVTLADGGLQLSLSGGGTLDADLVVCATGVTPNMAFLEGSGIETDRGIVVDDRLQTSRDGIFAAGDVAQGPDFSTGETAIHAIQPTASEHGRIAAMNMAGIDTPYRGSLALNVLNTLGLISSSYGLWQGVEGGDRAVARDDEAFKYLRLEFDGDVLVGALALGLTQHVGVLRGLIQTKTPLGPWKDMLMRDPHIVMQAYLSCAQGAAARTHKG
ncbi:MAG: NAD(P)/FAD-dependent oxidoreductase [Alphaproteobacteria bacterium]|nr:NAD(P)/FAD-dependent oxidoreductase [Alphaproteobacteria bacterium]